ncbi:G-protein coupled receptor Mth2-like [Musca autumnalis]|uniref:G-protein coupled receptor Mth2-like n=1 Tax=Musca autumnalis TaxID=221902 RepID=UPI003CEBF0F5
MNHQIWKRNNIACMLLMAFCLGSATTNSYAKEMRSCEFEETVDLKNALRFPNGSYLYNNELLVTPNQVEIYDYEEVFDGKRIPREPHPRACLCNTYDPIRKKIYCIKFCCEQPVREYIANFSLGCEELNTDLPYTPQHDIVYGPVYNILKSDVTTDLLRTSGIPCTNGYILDRRGDDNETWKLYANGTLSVFNGELHLSRRDYCMVFAPKENGKEKILSPMLCPVLVVNEEVTLDAVTSIAGIITAVFIVITLLAYVLLPNLQNFQGKLLVCFLLSLTVGSIMLCIIALPNVVFPHFICGCLGFMGYYFLVVSYCWLNAMSYNMFKQLHKSNADQP